MKPQSFSAVGIMFLMVLNEKTVWQENIQSSPFYFPSIFANPLRLLWPAKPNSSSQRGESNENLVCNSSQEKREILIKHGKLSEPKENRKILCTLGRAFSAQNFINSARYIAEQFLSSKSNINLNPGVH